MQNQQHFCLEVWILSVLLTVTIWFCCFVYHAHFFSRELWLAGNKSSGILRADISLCNHLFYTDACQWTSWVALAVFVQLWLLCLFICLCFENSFSLNQESVTLWKVVLLWHLFCRFTAKELCGRRPAVSSAFTSSSVLLCLLSPLTFIESPWLNQCTASLSSGHRGAVTRVDDARRWGGCAPCSRVTSWVRWSDSSLMSCQRS